MLSSSLGSSIRNATSFDISIRINALVNHPDNLQANLLSIKTAKEGEKDEVKKDKDADDDNHNDDDDVGIEKGEEDKDSER